MDVGDAGKAASVLCTKGLGAVPGCSAHGDAERSGCTNGHGPGEAPELLRGLRGRPLAPANAGAGQVPATAERSPCEGKQRFDSPGLANEVNRQRNKTRTEPRSVYRCPYCKGFHLTGKKTMDKRKGFKCK